ncbi:MAG TPA: 50S ribosomal protein L10 [Clostridiales bacterium]|nr:50S ribosomal protein L10 [Clostridiales bacterium]
MSAALEEKKKLVEELKEKIGAAKSVVIVDYKGLSVFEDTELRKTLREANVEYRVLKNRLMQKAFNELGYSDFDEALNGPTAVAFANGDPVAPAKILLDSADKTKKLTVKCGMVDGTYINVDGVKELATLPPKEVLLAKLLGTLEAPISGLARVLNETVAGLARVLNQIAEK